MKQTGLVVPLREVGVSAELVNVSEQKEVAMRSAATISESGKYRFDLLRVWDETKPLALWVLLNPSTATADVDDPTARRVRGFTLDHLPQCGGFVVCNLYALRTTKPKHLLDAQNAEGWPNNIQMIGHYMRSADVAEVVFGWGSWLTPKRPLRTPVEDMAAELGRFPLCLGKTVNGNPKHPLFGAANTPLIPYL